MKVKDKNAKLYLFTDNHNLSEIDLDKTNQILFRIKLYTTYFTLNIPAKAISL